MLPNGPVLHLQVGQNLLPPTHTPPSTPISHLGGQIKHSERRRQVVSSRPHPKTGLTGVSSCLAGREWILLSSLLHHVLCRRHVGLLTSGCSTRGRGPMPTPRQLAPRSPFTSFQPTQHTLPKRVLGGGGAGRESHSPPSQGLKMLLTLNFPEPQTASKSFPPPAPRGSIQSVCRALQSGGLDRELVSGSGTPPFTRPTPSPPEAHARSLGPRPSQSWRGEGWRGGTLSPFGWKRDLG